MTNQSVYSIKLDDTQISAESRNLHYSIARLLLQNCDEPPRVYTLEGQDKTLLVTNGLCATLFVDGRLCFKGGFALDDTYRSQRFSYDVVKLEPGQRFKYLTEATLDSSVAEYRELVLYENENVPAAILTYLNEVYANELDFIGKLPPGQQFILRQNLLKLGSPVLFANGGSAVVLKNWRETFQHLNHLYNTKIARKRHNQIVAFPTHRGSPYPEAVTLVTDDPKQPAVSCVYRSSAQHLEEYGTSRAKDLSYEHIPGSGIYILIWERDRPRMYCTTREAVQLVRDYFATVAQEPAAIIGVGTCYKMRLLREMLSFIYGHGIPCYANIADLEVCTGGPAAQFVGLVVSKRRYKSLLVNRTLSELKQKCA